MRKLTLLTTAAMTALALASAHADPAQTEQDQQPLKETCPVNTASKDGGVTICHDDKGSVEVTIPVDPNFFKYPLGQSEHGALKEFFTYPMGNSDHSVPNDVGRAIGKVFGW